MLTFLKNVFKKGELRRKVIFTLGILFVYRLGAGITIPGVDVGSLNSSDATNGIFGIMNLLGGGTLERFSLFALGVSPYITSSIIIELLNSIFALSDSSAMILKFLNFFENILL